MPVISCGRFPKIYPHLLHLMTSWQWGGINMMQKPEEGGFTGNYSFPLLFIEKRKKMRISHISVIIVTALEKTSRNIQCFVSRYSRMLPCLCLKKINRN